MFPPEAYKNPDRPASYEEYVADKTRVPKAEDLFHYFNNALFTASLNMNLLKRSIEKAQLSIEEQQAMLEKIADIDKRHGILQQIALDAIRELAKFQQ